MNEWMKKWLWRRLQYPEVADFLASWGQQRRAVSKTYKPNTFKIPCTCLKLDAHLDIQQMWSIISNKFGVKDVYSMNLIPIFTLLFSILLGSNNPWGKYLSMLKISCKADSRHCAFGTAADAMRAIRINQNSKRCRLQNHNSKLIDPL